MSGCPCNYTDRCMKLCSCANHGMSGGCLRCCLYGSESQKIAKAKRLTDMHEKLNKALNILHELVNIHECAWAQSLPHDKSCKEYETNIQGVQMSGCYVCRAKELLDD